jgi:hypothetical protein
MTEYQCSRDQQTYGDEHYQQRHDNILRVTKLNDSSAPQ